MIPELKPSSAPLLAPVLRNFVLGALRHDRSYRWHHSSATVSDVHSFGSRRGCENGCAENRTDGYDEDYGSDVWAIVISPA